MIAPRNLEEKQQEKNRLLKKYRAAKRAQWKDLCRREPRLPLYRRALRKADNPAAILTALADSWLRCAPMDIRHAALRQIDAHANRMARTVLDDPLPPATNVFLTARKLLAVR